MRISKRRNTPKKNWIKFIKITNPKLSGVRPPVTGKMLLLAIALQPVIKGPLSRRDIYAWLIGAGSPFIKAHGLAMGFFQRHQGADMVDSRTEFGRMFRNWSTWEDSRAADYPEFPGAYDYGCQENIVLDNVVTNWMGDDGFIKNLNGTLKRFNIGRRYPLDEKAKSLKNISLTDEHLVDIECWGENQRGEITRWPVRHRHGCPSKNAAKK